MLEFVHHLATKNIFRPVNSGRIYQDDLSVIAVDDSLNAVAGGLRLGRNDGDFAAYELVYKRGFSGVGAADDRDVA